MHSTKQPPMIAVDLLRFACALLVVLYHFDVAFWSAPTRRAAVELIPVGAGYGGTDITRIGWIGVELFFVISGLVIARSVTGQTATSFLRRRALRLVPGAWVCAGITAMAMLSSGLGGTIAAPLLRSVTFWPIGEQIDGSYWTLGIECSFYAVMALAIRLGVDGNEVEQVGVAIGLLSTAFWAAWLLVGRSIAPPPGDRYVMLALLPHGCFFAIGILIAAWQDSRALRHAALLGLFVLCATVEIGQQVVERAKAGVIASPILALSVFLVGVALLLSADRLQPWLSRRIEPVIARKVGLLTYPLYLLHQDAGAAVLGALAAAGIPARLAVGLTVSMSVGVAWQIAAHFEPRLRRALTAALPVGARSDKSGRFPKAWTFRNLGQPSASLPQSPSPEISQSAHHQPSA